MHKIAKATTVILAAVFTLTIAACSPSTPSEFTGDWKVSDTSGASFVITLGGNGTASANRSGEGMEGTWKEEGGAAVITWKDGWITKIAKVGDAYKKTAWDKGVSLDGAPTNTSDAEKAK